MASGNSSTQSRPCFVAEGGRVVRDGVIVENRQRRIEVVEPRIDELEADDRHSHDVGDLGVGTLVGPKSMARQDRRADDQQIALTLVGVVGVGGLEAVDAHPLGVGGGLAGALWVGEAGDDGLAVDDEATVRGVDHVGQTRDGLDELDSVAE